MMVIREVIGHRRENLFPMILICQKCGKRQDLPENPEPGHAIRCDSCAAPMTLCYQNGDPLE